MTSNFTICIEINTGVTYSSQMFKNASEIKFLILNRIKITQNAGSLMTSYFKTVNF